MGKTGNRFSGSQKMSAVLSICFSGSQKMSAVLSICSYGGPRKSLIFAGEEVPRMAL